MRRLISIVLVVGLLAIGINDLSRWATAQRNLTTMTDTLASKGADLAAQGQSREMVAAQLVAQAQPQGVTIYMYDQNAQGAQVWTQFEVTGTLVAGPVAALILNKPFKEALHAPLTIRDYATAGTR